MKLRSVICATIIAAIGCSESSQAPATTSVIVLRAGTGAGVVSSSVPGIDCGSDCIGVYDVGTVVALTATPAPGSAFAGWSGGECSGTGPCLLTLTATTTLTATFTLNQYPLTVTRQGNGTGTVTSSPSGVNCGSDCSGSFGHGTTITLNAVPAAGSVFAGWSGACLGTDACSVNLTGATTVSARFNLTQHVLNVTRDGAGTGTVTSNPAGLSCGFDCDEAYNNGARVTLTASPLPGSTFAGWSGGGCSGTGTCVVTVTAATSVNATFNLAQYTLTVAKVGIGSGVVTSTDGGVSCGSDCSEAYPNGTSVTLVPSPAGGSTFGGWSGGGCSGTGTCTVTVTAATTVTATFSLPQHFLTVARSGTGTGTVTSSPAGVSCGADCSEPYTVGTRVTLTASAAQGSAFAGWIGAGCTGTGTCVVTVTAPTTLTATFSDIAPPTLESSAPADATIGVDEATTIRLTFSEPMNQAITQSAFQVIEPAGVTGTFQWQGNVMTFTPSSSFACTAGGMIVYWRLSTLARDVAGNPLAAQVDRSFRVFRCVEDSLVGESSRDGYITSTGTVDSSGSTIYVGDYPNDTYARGFVSFDFSSLPSDAVVTGANLQMSFTPLGTVAQLGPLLAEPVSYGTLGASDFGLAATGPAVPAAVTTQASWAVDAAMIAAWANRATLGSRLQLRVRTTYDSHHNGTADAYGFDSTESAVTLRRPLLIVRYKAR